MMDLEAADREHCISDDEEDKPALDLVEKKN